LRCRARASAAAARLAGGCPTTTSRQLRGSHLVELAPERGPAFDELVAMLRSRDEWAFVEREWDIRLSRGNRAPGA
jgi:hypothetical protein